MGKLVLYLGQEAGRRVLEIAKHEFDGELVVVSHRSVGGWEEHESPDRLLFEAQDANVLICCHGRKIVPKQITTNIPCVNIHPCLTDYKGADPIGRWLKDDQKWASVGAHFMTNVVDEGNKIIEKWVRIENHDQTRDSIYNYLYPLYEAVAAHILKLIKSGELIQLWKSKGNREI